MDSTAGNFSLSDFFIPSTYTDSTGRTLPCYLLTKKGSDKNMPTQRAMDLGLFFIKESPRISKDGAVIDRVAKVTPKGQKYFLNRYAPAPKSVLQAVSQ